MNTTTFYIPQLADIEKAAERLQGVVQRTPLLSNLSFSEKYEANIQFKREDLQVVRSYKIRGAYNRISQLSQTQKENGVVCASAGNHAQGVAYSCRMLEVNATIFMPAPTPKQKVDQVKFFGKNWVDVVLIGDTFDDAYHLAQEYCQKQKAVFIHPFDDEQVIEGQGTVGLEVLADASEPIDYLFLPVGGGGLSAGVSTVFRQLSPNTKIIGVEPEGAPAMLKSLEAGENVVLKDIDKFVDGAAVQAVGAKTFQICKQNLDQVITVPEGLVCTTILALYNREAIVVEPAGALSVAALNLFHEEIKGKNVVCVLSGSNNDISRTEEIRERSLLYEGLKHYFIVRFPQRAGALRDFLVEVLGPNDDIVHFEYTKKTAREKGPALIGIEHLNQEDFEPLLERMKSRNYQVEYLNEQPNLFGFIL
ncbi:threonine dehydratase [Roseivirga spongicola]|uniref:L-threonine dehydratase n=1 Tax=Roseivirga spongicola TaxID=333140 RepID=A0A150X471_9BACT|nr:MULTISPECIES: threonine ammonia-lyase [Roseivirga]KYG73519.1 threonine dehydratase [Roseivirga spongicola]MBO6659784.1 threonine ammonia-lyase [Roseivirga sp.]MBO6762153.1 threonine ammonia-lyase [Roseivirga sp.]MBO6907479.1 threonine ammonia-lyase [Roseivirga sp.]